MSGKLRGRLGSEAGYTLPELLVSVSILGAVMASISTMLVSATNAEVDMNRRFQAQTQARLGLDKLRREVHCATSVAVSGGGTTAVLTIPSTCPTAAGLTSLTWCTKANGARWDLWRYEGGSCSGTGRIHASSLNESALFTYTAQNTSKLAFLSVRIPVNVKGSKTVKTYVLEDDIVLRNSTRT